MREGSENVWTNLDFFGGKLNEDFRKKMLDQLSNYLDEDEDIRRKSNMLRRNKKCFCKIENSFLRFDFY